MKILFEDYGGDLDSETSKKLLLVAEYNKKELLKTEKYSRLCLCLRYPFQCSMFIPIPNIPNPQIPLPNQLRK